MIMRMMQRFPFVPCANKETATGLFHLKNGESALDYLSGTAEFDGRDTMKISNLSFLI